MAGFQKVGGRDVETKARTVSSEALAVGDLVMASRSAYKVTAATATSTISLLQGGGIVSKATTTADTEVQIQDIVPGATYIVATTNNSDATHNYQRMKMTSAHEVNNTGTDVTDYCVFMQTGVVGATTDKKIKGEFLVALT